MQEENTAFQCPSDICTELVGLTSQKLTYVITIAQTTGNQLILTWKDRDTPARTLVCISKVPTYIKSEQGSPNFLLL